MFETKSVHTKHIKREDKQVGAKLKLGRLLRNYSQSNLADKLGITFQQVQKYETGYNRISISRLFQISRALSLPVSYFLKDIDGYRKNHNSKEIVKVSDEMLDFITTNSGHRLVKYYLSIENKKAREKIINIVQLISEDE